MLPISKTIETDLVVIGGGIGGLMAAIAAAEQGTRVVVLEKADTRRSGSGGGGCDHFFCYLPEVHGDNLDVIFQELMESQIGSCYDPLLTYQFMKMSASIVRKWHEWGINMKPYDNEFVFRGHAFPGRPRIWLKYDGHNQKAVLTQKARSLGVTILNHHAVLELLHDGTRALGALALDNSRSEPSFVLVQSRCVMMASGTASRLYTPMSTPSTMFNTANSPANAGAGHAQALRAGARLVNFELPYRHSGHKYWTRAGKGTWIGIFKYPDGTNVGPFITKATKEVSDITSDVWNNVFTDMAREGRAPIYMDCSQIDEEDFQCMMKDFESEGLTSFLNYMGKRHLDLRKQAVEFGQFEPYFLGRGVEIGIDGQTTLPGLYAAGDVVGNVRGAIAGAAVYGWICGESIGKSFRNLDIKPVADLDMTQERMEFFSSLYERESGAPWQEGNWGLQQILTDYAGAGPERVRSETLLTAGLKTLGELRELCKAEMKVSNSHELMRAAEVFDLMDVGEAIMLCARERRETRGLHIRKDYPFTNPLYNKKLFYIERRNGEYVVGMRDKYK